MADDNYTAKEQSLIKQKQALGEINTLEEARALIAERRAKLADEELQKLAKIAYEFEEYQAQLEDELDTAQRHLQVLEAKGAATLAQRKEAEEAVKAAEDALKFAQAHEKSAEGLIEGKRQERDHQEAIADGAKRARQEQEKALGSISTTLTMMTGVSESWKASGIGSMIVLAQTQGLAVALGTVGTAMASLFTLQNILMSGFIGIGAVIVKMAFGLAKAQDSLMKATGAGEKYNEVLAGTNSEMRKMGLSADDAGQAIATARGEMKAFSDITDVGGFAVFSGAMEKMGVSAQANSQMMDHFMATLGYTQQQAQGMSADMVGLGRALEMNVSQVVAELNQNFDRLAVFGDNATGEFKNLLGMSKALKMEMGSLIDNVEEYNTVSGSMARAARINTVLGYAAIDANKMRNATYSERIMLEKKAFEQSGKSFKSMSMIEKQRMKAAFGFEKMSNAMKFFGNTSSAEMERMAKKAEESGMTIEELMEEAKKAQDPMANFAKAFATLAEAALPVLEILNFLLSPFVLLAENTNAWVTVAAMAGAFWTLGKVGAFVKSIWTGSWLTDSLGGAGESAAKAGKGAEKGGKSFGTALKNIAKHGRQAVPVLLGLGAAALMIGGGIAIAALGVAEFVKAFKDFSGGQIMAISFALLVFAATLIGVIIALGSAGTMAMTMMIPFVAIAGVFFAVALAFRVAAWGIAAIAEGLAVMLPYTDQLGTFAQWFAMLAVSAIGVGAGGFIAMAGLLAMAVGLVGLAFSLFFIKTDDLVALGNMMQGLGKVAEFAGKGMSSAVPKVKSLMKTLLSMKTWLDAEGIAPALRRMGNAFVDVGNAAYVGNTYLPGFNESLRETLNISVSFTEPLQFLNDGLERFVSLLDTMVLRSFGLYIFADALSSVGSSLWWFGYSVNRLSIPHLEAFDLSMDAMAEATPEIVKINPQTGENLINVADAVRDIGWSSWLFKGPMTQLTELVEAINSANAAQPAAAGAGANAGETVVVLKLNDRELGRSVKQALAKEQYPLNIQK